MRKFFKFLQWLIFIAFVVIQFFPPSRNTSSGPAPESITKKFVVPDEVNGIIKTSCYDCHSNNTVYPWYTHIQPVGWWMQGHVNDGKADLNFDTFSSYPLWRQFRKFSGIKKQVQDGDMPLPSYTLIHRYAVLSVHQTEVLAKWCDEMRAYMQAHYPADSLKKKEARPE